MDIRRDELPLALLMFSYFFLVITCFWILKPIKKGLFIEFYDQDGFDAMGTAFTAPQAELLAKVLNMVVAFAAVVVFSYLSRQFRRQQLTYIFARSLSSATCCSRACWLHRMNRASGVSICLAIFTAP